MKKNNAKELFIAKDNKIDIILGCKWGIFAHGDKNNRNDEVKSNKYAKKYFKYKDKQRIIINDIYLKRKYSYIINIWLIIII